MEAGEFATIQELAEAERRLRVSLFALIEDEPPSTAAQPFLAKRLKRQTFLNASRFG